VEEDQKPGAWPAWQVCACAAVQKVSGLASLMPRAKLSDRMMGLSSGRNLRLYLLRE
jgi:hypothetical protein